MRIVKGTGIVVPPVVLLPAGKLNDAPYNPQKMAPHKYAALKAGIRQNGFLVPLTVQKHSPAHGPLVILGGHSRRRAVAEICEEDGRPLPSLPCIVVDVVDRDAKKINLELNNVEGEPEVHALANVLASIHAEKSITLEERVELGFADDDLDALLKLNDPPAIPPLAEPPVFGRSLTLSLEFASVESRDACRAKVAALADAKGKKTGEVVLSLLRGRK